VTFDLARFSSADLAPRQAMVAVPDLAYWFGEDADPVHTVWTVRGLSGEEIARANESSARHKIMLSAVEALASAGTARADQVEAIQRLIGYGPDVPEDLARRFDHLTYGSVDPAIDRATAVRLFAAYPIVAYQLSNKILELTGLGPDLGKAPHSTPTPAS
jgi:hypothetical protein